MGSQDKTSSASALERFVSIYTTESSINRVTDEIEQSRHLPDDQQLDARQVADRESKVGNLSRAASSMAIMVAQEQPLYTNEGMRRWGAHVALTSLIVATKTNVQQIVGAGTGRNGGTATLVGNADTAGKQLDLMSELLIEAFR